MPTPKRIAAIKALRKRRDPAEEGLKAGQDTMARILAKADPDAGRTVIRMYSTKKIFAPGSILAGAFGEG
jgi:hypothetical protein